MIKNVIKLLIIFVISALIGNMAYGMYRENTIKDEPTINSINTISISNQTNEIESSVIEEKIDEKYKGYDVSSKLIIPSIDLDTYVFEEYNEETMDICPAKYYGPEPNEVGNYCIAAHNYKKENMFNNIIKLKKGDIIILQDNKHGKVEYEVYDIYKVKPEETDSLSQETGGKRQITLITCSDYSSKRIIVKAVEK